MKFTPSITTPFIIHHQHYNSSPPSLTPTIQVMVALWGQDRGVELWEAYQAAPSLPHRTYEAGVWLFPTALEYDEACPRSNISQSIRGEAARTTFAATTFPSENVAGRRRNLTGLHLRCLTASVSVNYAL